MSKSRKRSLSKGKHGGFAAKTVKEQKPLFHFVLEFFLSLWKLGQKFFSFWPRENKKELSSLLERPDAAPSSSALPTPSGVSVAARRASEEQTVGPAGKILSSGTVNDKDPCHGPSSTRNSNEALILGPEDVEAVISSNRVVDGGIVRMDRVGYQKKEEAKVNSLERLHVIEEDEVKSERPGSDSGDWKNDEKKEVDDLKKENHDLKKEVDDLKKENHDLKKEVHDLKKEGEVFEEMVLLRQVFSDFRMTRSAEIMDNGIMKEVLKLPEARSENFDMIIGNVPFTRILLLMLFQRANMVMKSSFWTSKWRNHHRFPKFSNNSDDYNWWKKNFVPKILKKRLEVLRVAAKNWNPKLEIFMIIKLVSDLNLRLHRQPSEIKFNEKNEVKMFEYEGIDLQTTICYLRFGGDSKI